MKTRMLFGAIWGRKLLTVVTLIVVVLWCGSTFRIFWYAVREPATAISMLVDERGILVQRISLTDEMRNAPGAAYGAFISMPFNEWMAMNPDQSYAIPRMGLLGVPTHIPWKTVRMEDSTSYIQTLDGDGRNFFLPYWLIFLALLLLWLRPHRKGIIASILQKWRPKLEPPPLPPPTVDQGPQPTA